MPEKPYDPNYPEMIDLDRPTPSFDGPSVGGKKDKQSSKKVGASLFITGGPELAKLPKHGYALIEFDRTNISLGKPRGLVSSGGDGKQEEASAELEVHSICLPKGKTGDLASEFANFAKKSGVDTGAMGDDESSEYKPDDEQAEGEES